MPVEAGVIKVEFEGDDLFLLSGVRQSAATLGRVMAKKWTPLVSRVESIVDDGPDGLIIRYTKVGVFNNRGLILRRGLQLGCNSMFCSFA